MAPEMPGMPFSIADHFHCCSMISSHSAPVDAATAWRRNIYADGMYASSPGAPLLIVLHVSFGSIGTQHLGQVFQPVVCWAHVFQHWYPTPVFQLLGSCLYRDCEVCQCLGSA